MPDLLESLQGRDLGHLRIIAELWGMELNAPDARVGLQRLIPMLLDRELVKQVVDELPDEARQALSDLLRNGGRLSFSSFTRQYGLIREVGPGRRDRERTYQHPASITELLWYRALIGHSFLSTPNGPEEFVYIPEDFIQLLPMTSEQKKHYFGKIVTTGEKAIVLLANDHILDHACTYLAGLRCGYDEEFIADFIRENGHPVPLILPFLKSLLSEADLFDDLGMHYPEATRRFLETGRRQALAMLVKVWLTGTEINELRMTPGLIFDGEWKNNPLHTRQSIINMLEATPGGDLILQGDDKLDRMSRTECPWISLLSFQSSIRENCADFQRRAGDYDSWFIRDAQSGEFLRGFEHWDRIEGALLGYLLTGPMHWLGILDLTLADNIPLEDPISIYRSSGAFRFSQWAAYLLKGEVPAGSTMSEEFKIQVYSDGRVRVPRQAPRAARYQIARFCSWVDYRDEDFYYRLTSGSLDRARQQGLKITHLLGLLRSYALNIPPNLVKALERWEEKGGEASIEQVVLLRLRSPEQIQTLRASRAARFLGDILGPTAVIIKPGAVEIVLSVLAELGYLGEYRYETEQLENKSPK